LVPRASRWASAAEIDGNASSPPPIAFEDLLVYVRKMREKQAAALERMAGNARELGLDY
jgi:hypothetical protein